MTRVSVSLLYKQTHFFNMDAERNSVEANFRFHHGSMFGMSFFLVENIFHQDTSQDLSQVVWQAQTVHQFKKNECDDYIFTIFMEVNGKNTTELEHKDEFEENYMTRIALRVPTLTVYVKTISGKTIRIKCDKKQKADTVSKK